MSTVEINSLPCPSAKTNASTNIVEFFESRSINPDLIAKLSGMPEREMSEILKPESNPTISQLTKIHRAINELTYCPIADLLEPGQAILPTPSNKKHLIVLWEISNSLREEITNKQGNTILATGLKADALEVFSLSTKFLEQIEHILNYSTPKSPSYFLSIENQILQMPKNGCLHVIAQRLPEDGKKEYRNALNKMLAGEDTSRMKISAYDRELLFKILKPSFDFTLKELLYIRDNFFMETSDTRVGDLINVSETEVIDGPERLNSRYCADVLTLGSICRGLFHSEYSNKTAFSSYFEVIERLMADLDPEWRNHSNGNSYTKRSGNLPKISKTELNQISLSDCDYSLLND